MTLLTKPLLLVADDESKIRRLVIKGLERAGFEVASAADGLEVLRRLSASEEGGERLPDLLILDLMMPGLSGLEVLEAVRQKWSIPAIMLTARDESVVKLSAFRIGADDYLTKPFLMEELEARVRAVLRRSQPAVRQDEAAAEELRSGALSLRPRLWQAAWQGRPLKLPKREFLILAALMKRPNAVVTHEALLRAGWGADEPADLNALRVTVARLRRHFSEAGIDPAALSSFSGVGYMLGDLSEWEE